MLIADEVQCGMGRTGKWWAGDHSGLEPDILCVAKGIASGMPISATIAPANIMDWPPGAHASTFGGNPVCAAAALATIKLLESDYIENAARMGQYIFQRIGDWPERFAAVGDVRGKGLMIGIEMVKDKRSKEPAPEMRDAIIQQAFLKGLLVLGAGECTIRLSPPLVIDAQQADFAIEILEGCIRELQI
jgi:4-aminobutyrate aminotransferase